MTGETSGQAGGRAEFRRVALAEIAVGERLRAVNEEMAAALARDMERRGLINPVTLAGPVARAPGPAYELVAGAHRLRAAGMLGWSEIDAMVAPLSGGRDGLLVEIAENLFRNDLSALERALFVAAYREAWEERHGRIRRGPNRISARRLQFEP